MKTVLGIETSCDETAAAVVREDGHILSNIIYSQVREHAEFGGVVPEIAARAHVEHLDNIIAMAMSEAGIRFTGLDGVAATAGPGLLGGLMVGLTTAKAIALVHSLPLIAVNHLEGHALSVGLSDGILPPYLLLLISGGHSQLVMVASASDYHRIGTTVDDALGEAFDKTAKILGIGYPGGPQVELWASKGDGDRFKLPRPMWGKEGANFSFSGLKTAVRQTVQKIAPLDEQDIADICASFEMAVTDSVADRVKNAMQIYKQKIGEKQPLRLVVAGGVAANKTLRSALTQIADMHGFAINIPPARLCTDNGAMIAWAGISRLQAGHKSTLDAEVKARWPLDTA
jgi:N6-L-threonylcarbamoyladenine synthase